MIQRIQSVYLFAAAIAAVLLLFLPLGHVLPMASMPELPQSADMMEQNLSSFPLLASDYILWMIVALVMVSIALFDVFLFSNRRLQIRVAGLAVFCAAVFIGLYLFDVKDSLQGMRPTVGTFLPLVYILLVLLAQRGIRSDEALIRSADRFR